MEKKEKISLKVIEKWLNDGDNDVRAAAMNACTGREIPLKIIEKGLNDGDWRVREAAMNACAGREIPMKIIEKGLNDRYSDVRIVAVNACVGREIPVEILEKCLNDSDWRVRAAAMNACAGREVNASRSFEPNNKVFKKCLNNVIVVAEIPLTAHVRGDIGSKCRSSEAVIVDIIGDVCGENIGISYYDRNTFYFIGDHIKIPDFDFSDNECGKGYHFFNTIEEARNYSL